MQNLLKTIRCAVQPGYKGIVHATPRL